MGYIELLILAVSLSMDAFAVSVCKGLAMKRIKFGRAAAVGLWFGVFQALMPAIGYFLGLGFRDMISKYDHWVAFALLAVLGVKMIVDTVRNKEENTTGTLDVKEMFLLALATSIDALAAGITIALEKKSGIVPSVLTIGAVTFALSAAGVYVGGVFGEKFNRPAKFAGGAALVALGIKILVEGLLHG
ncbi:MAG: manganese efflux pump [Clostridia bacterium]|nr:manganese efflux pump [Clostridia bacterium]MBR6289968.1 manganese efflux pump [Clostridia bacterium]